MTTHYNLLSELSVAGVDSSTLTSQQNKSDTKWWIIIVSDKRFFRNQIQQQKKQNTSQKNIRKCFRLIYLLNLSVLYSALFQPTD